MIKGTNTDCKITDISVVGSTATLTCLFFASDKTEQPVGLKFLLADVGSDELYQLDNVVYWVDNINENDADVFKRNVNIEGYKELKLNIDITKNNEASMQQDRWYRKCYIILTDITDSYNKPLWSSDVLDLVSESIELPQIKNISIYNKPIYVQSLNDFENRLFINFKYLYTSEVDINYNNKNIKTYVVIKSISTGNIIETIESMTVENMKIESSIGYNYNEPILLEIYITNLKKEVLKQMSFIYKPFVKRSYGYIKTNKGVQKIRQIAIKKGD